MDFIEQLGKKRLFFDGSMGTMLQDKGLKAGELPEIWNITNSAVVFDIHKAYVDAGCNILKTNTFGANRLKLQDTEYNTPNVVSVAVEIAKKAAANAAYVALSIGSTGKLLSPFGDLDFEEAVSIFAEMVSAGAQAGADLILIETMSDTYEIKAAILAAKENCNLPVFVTFTLNETGRLLTGGDILSAICLIEGLGADALGLNCGLGASQMKELLPELAKLTSIPIIMNPNAGMPELFNGKTIFRVSPNEFATCMADIASYAHVLGGCCGTTPLHIAEMIQKCRSIPFMPPSEKYYTAVSSYGKSVVFGEKTVIIGERINPTGKPRMKQALNENDMGYLQREGLCQIEHGADILDVNVGTPGVDEPAMLASAVLALQSIMDTPLQIDTADPVAAERAMRLYNGKPLLNSVNGKQESLKTILPLVKKYGAAVVALALDDEGIPETAQCRFEVIKRIISSAEKLGIHKKNILVDALTMTVSTGANNAKITLDVMERVRNELRIPTILGVSNVSFGLPERERINAAFFTLAMSRGLGAGIINPLNTQMMDAFHTYNALNGIDLNCSTYINKFSKKEARSVNPINIAPPTTTLHNAVINGLHAQAAKIAKTMLTEIAPLDVINNHLIPALDQVGKNFECGSIFLPQLLMSAEAAKSAFETIKHHMAAHGTAQKKRGKVVLATVKGDVHDIGKNIVKVLLENYNFHVIDLGKNVDPAIIIETAVKEQVKLVGLSALMTTTVTAMEETILLLKQALPNCHVMVGGAVLTAEFAEKIGADYYAKDAINGVRYAEGLFNCN